MHLFETFYTTGISVQQERTILTIVMKRCTRLHHDTSTFVCWLKKKFPFSVARWAAVEFSTLMNTRLEGQSIHEMAYHHQQQLHNRIDDKAAGCVFIIDLSNCLDLYSLFVAIRCLTHTFRYLLWRPPDTIAAALNYYHRFTRAARSIPDPYVFTCIFANSHIALTHLSLCFIDCITHQLNFECIEILRYFVSLKSFRFLRRLLQRHACSLRAKHKKHSVLLAILQT